MIKKMGKDTYFVTDTSGKTYRVRIEDSIISCGCLEFKKNGNCQHTDSVIRQEKVVVKKRVDPYTFTKKYDRFFKPVEKFLQGGGEK